MSSSPRLLLALAAAAAAGLIATPARADSIDGDWCAGASHMFIEGTKITTPGRKVVQGDYFRYRFNYVAPEGEPGAGGEIRLVMIRGQEIVHLTRAGQTGDPEIWRRCKPIS